MPIVVTVNLTVTGTVLTNTVFAGGVPTPNAGPAPVGGAPVVLNEGTGWADVGNNTEYINIPIASQVPLLSPSNSDIVFDLLRDSNGNPVYTNSSTQWPVLGPPSTGGVQSLTITSPGSNYTCANGNSVGTPGKLHHPAVVLRVSAFGHQLRPAAPRRAEPRPLVMPSSIRPPERFRATSLPAPAPATPIRRT